MIVIGGTRLRFLLPDPPEIALRGKSKGKKRKLGQMSGGDSDSDDPNREQHQKPPYPYSYLIAQAILSSPQKKLTLNAIYQEISARYPYFRMDVTGWQNSVRHNLSLNKAFVKVKRPENEPGKGAFWMVAEGTEVSSGCVPLFSHPANFIHSQWYIAVNQAPIPVAHNQSQQLLAKGLQKELWKESEKEAKRILEALGDSPEMVSRRLKWKGRMGYRWSPSWTRWTWMLLQYLRMVLSRRKHRQQRSCKSRRNSSQRR